MADKYPQYFKKNVAWKTPNMQVANEKAMSQMYMQVLLLLLVVYYTASRTRFAAAHATAAHTHNKLGA
jgi:hypothetical protein